MSGHTPGPWQVDDEAQVIAANKVLARCDAAPSIAVADANAARIVACVNYCEGEIDLQPGELAKLRDRHAELLARCDSLRQQRDELAAALRLAEDRLQSIIEHDADEGHPEDTLTISAWEAALAALAKLEPPNL